MRDIISVISGLIQKLNPQAATMTLGPQTDLLSSDILDSMLTVQLVLALEEEFKITFQFEDIKPENFKTTENISSLLKTKYSV
jgi:acyl carrier protein